MSIIKRRPKENLKPTSFRLPESLIERLTAFADYTNVPQAEIVCAALNHVIDSDREFAAVMSAGSSRVIKDSAGGVTAGSNTRRNKSTGDAIAESNTERAEAAGKARAGAA